jgi:two-component system cell cycle sensor histidine kinase/response regulator CckA
LRDVTVRREAEAAVRESEQRYRELIENARDIIYTTDLEGRITAINEAAVILTGYGRDEMLGQRLSAFIEPAHRDAAERVLEDVRSGSPTTAAIVVLTRDGGGIHLELSNWMQLRDGVPVAIQGIARDVTRRDDLETQLRQAQKMEAVGQLAGGIAHDFNNLLTVIAGFAELAQESVPRGSEAGRYLWEVRRASDHAASVTRQLLAFGRRQTLQPAVVDLNVIVVQLLEMVGRLLGEHIVHSTKLDEAVWCVRVDPAQIQQVLLNLVVNARDAMPAGGTLSIETSNVTLADGSLPGLDSAGPGDYAVVTVQDTGTGMDAHTLAHIFEPFFTTKGVGRGSGLGLATVWGIVKQSGGQVSVTSTPGHGSRFTVYLPRASEELQARSPTAGNGSANATRQATIVLVEDEQGVRRFAEEVLRGAGHDVWSFSTPTDVLQALPEMPMAPDLLVTDMVLPALSGRQLAARLSEHWPSLSVLYVSGYGDHPSLAEAGAAVASPDVPKPFSADQLREAVRVALDRPVRGTTA